MCPEGSTTGSATTSTTTGRCSTRSASTTGPELKGADVLKVVDKVISAIQEHGITEDELKQAKVNFRSSFLENLESGAGFGRADLLAALALYDDDPNRINTILTDLEKVTTAEVQAPRRNTWCPRTAPRSIAGRKGVRNEGASKMRGRFRRIVIRVAAVVVRHRVRLGRSNASAQTERPAVGPSGRFSWRRGWSGRCRTACVSSSRGRRRFRRSRSR